MRFPIRTSSFSRDSILFTFFLAALAALPPLATDLYLSTLPVIGRALGSTTITAGYTISIFLGCFAVSQLVFGALSDRMGRRPVGLLGCALFSIAGFGSSIAGSMGALLCWRGLEGIGAGAAAVLAYAIVQDLFYGSEARIKISYVSATQALAPMIAPLLGSLLYRLVGWRSLFGFLGTAGILLTGVFAFGFRESLLQEQRNNEAPSMLVRNYGRIFCNLPSLAYCLLNACCMGALLAFLTGSSFVFIDFLGLRPTPYGWVLFLTAFGTMIGSWLSGRLVKHNVPPHRILSISLALTLVATGGMLALGLAKNYRVITALPLALLMTTSIGLIVPNAALGVLVRMKEITGTASALFGCMGMLGGAVASAIVSAISAETPTALSFVMTVCSTLGILIYATLAAPGDRALQRAATHMS
jgi:MFS transporter, DHA1 family, multidrug resistance protein